MRCAMTSRASSRFSSVSFSGRVSISVSLRASARIVCGFRFGQPPLAFHMRTSKTRADGMHRALFFSLTRAPHNAVKLSTSKPASAVTRLAPSFGRYAIRRGDNCLFLFLDIFFLLRVLVNSARSQYRVARFQRTLTTTLRLYHKRSSAMNTVSIRPVRTPAIPIYNSSASTCTSTKPPAVDTFRERAWSIWNPGRWTPSGLVHTAKSSVRITLRLVKLGLVITGQKGTIRKARS